MTNSFVLRKYATVTVFLIHHFSPCRNFCQYSSILCVEPWSVEPWSVGVCLLSSESIMASCSNASARSNSIKCLVCEETFNVITSKDDFLAHLIQHHKLVIGDEHMIADLPKYVSYWRGRFSKQMDLKAFCSVIKTNTKPTDIGEAEDYYLLCDVLPEDRMIREKIQKERLIEVLEIQQKERECNGFSRGCLFCKKQFLGNRADVLDHMAQSHGFSVGLPNNLVFVAELLDVLEQKFSKFQCFYCDKLFKDRSVLKDHMRKKQHRRLNPRNTEYDKYYLINYLEFGKSWLSVRAEVDDDDGGEEAEEEDSSRYSHSDDVTDTDESEMMTTDVASSLDDVIEGSSAMCLFCTVTVPTSRINILVAHMKEAHGGFDLARCMSSEGAGTGVVTFYDRVKVINYVRHEVSGGRCVCCGRAHGDRADLLRHMTDMGHYRLPAPTGTGATAQPWNQPEYYFPILENDGLLCSLDDVLGVDAATTGAPAVDTSGGNVGAGADVRVVAEDVPTHRTTDSLLHNDTRLLQ